MQLRRMSNWGKITLEPQGDEILLSSLPHLPDEDLFGKAFRVDFAGTFALFIYWLENLILSEKVIQGLQMDFAAIVVKRNFENFLSQIDIAPSQREFIYFADLTVSDHVPFDPRVILNSRPTEPYHIIKYIVPMLLSLSDEGGTPLIDLEEPDPTLVPLHSFGDHFWAIENSVSYGIYDSIYSYMYRLALSKVEKKYSFTVRELYKAACDAIATDLNELWLVGKPVRVQIPPITSMVLGKVSRPAEIGEAVLEYRDKMKPARTALRDLKQLCAAGDTSVRESLQALRRYRYIMSELSREYGSVPISMSSWSDLLEVIPEDLSNALDQTDFDPKRLLASFLNRKAKQLIRRIKLRHFDFFFSLKKEVSKISTHDRLINKVFGYSPTEYDWRQFELLANSYHFDDI